VHVEVYVGPGNRTIAARWQKGVVQEFDDFHFVSEKYKILK